MNNQRRIVTAFRMIELQIPDLTRRKARYTDLREVQRVRFTAEIAPRGIVLSAAHARLREVKHNHAAAVPLPETRLNR